ERQRRVAVGGDADPGVGGADLDRAGPAMAAHAGGGGGRGRPRGGRRGGGGGPGSIEGGGGGLRGGGVEPRRGGGGGRRAGADGRRRAAGGRGLDVEPRPAGRDDAAVADRGDEAGLVERRDARVVDVDVAARRAVEHPVEIVRIAVAERRDQVAVVDQRVE